MRWRPFALSMLLAAGMSSAQGGALYTPPLSGAAGGTFLDCVVVNVSGGRRAEHIVVHIQLLDSTGAVALEGTFNVAPGHMEGISGGFVPSAGIRCAFKADGPTDNLRAAIRLIAPHQGTIMALAAD